MLLQQGEVVEHCWPYRPHTMPLLELLELLVAPELDEVVAPELDELPLLEVPQGPHVPSALPTGTMHVSPGQQSALTVHLPQFGTHEPPWKQM
jgi:hypothetical protein